MFLIPFFDASIIATSNPVPVKLAPLPVYHRGCLNLKAWQKLKKIKDGMSRRLADDQYLVAIETCRVKPPKKQETQKTAFISSINGRYIPPGRNGAPQGTWGGGTRFDFDMADAPKEGVDKPRLQRCSKKPCFRSQTTMFQESFNVVYVPQQVPREPKSIVSIFS